MVWLQYFALCTCYITFKANFKTFDLLIFEKSLKYIKSFNVRRPPLFDGPEHRLIGLNLARLNLCGLLFIDNLGGFGGFFFQIPFAKRSTFT